MYDEILNCVYPWAAVAMQQNKEAAMYKQLWEDRGKEILRLRAELENVKSGCCACTCK